PKPDTELLVELAAKLVEARAHALSARPHGAQPETLNIADICTGSGCIGISVFQEALDLHINPADMKFVLTDISKDALVIAQKNARSILGENAQNISFVQGDLLEPFLAGAETPQHFDIILSNPPYVPAAVTDELLLDERNEPRLALDGGSDGLDIIRRLIPQVWQALNKNGILLIETGEYNAAQTAELLKDSGFIEIATFNDLGGQPRVTQAKKP
ncbi:MAG: peptide chain release factor N(5)-glutamine methyltransferase, partial [Spirochaetaceae bacterium]|nr:peptide chain release factor N(5)-glutamine methyltransferase [Spirochaetaceae bacterium]